ncbi:MAG TPA: glycosyltransferase family 39 protein, partial [Terriglobales bacterium]
MILSHVSLLRLPYFWDEAGYYIPAARDLLSGSLIPYSTPSNAHPPLVLAWIVLAWKIFGQSPVVTRCAMLLLAGFSLTGLFRLAKSVSNQTVAIATTALTALYPVLFAQSSLAQVDLPAAGLTFWALEAYVRRRGWAMALWFSLAALAKETAILIPLALLAWEILRRMARPTVHGFRRENWFLLVPLLPLAGWYGYHFAHTGFVFGNPEFLRYNLQDNFHPLRIFLALMLRLWQTVGYLNLYVLTLACLIAMNYPALAGHDNATKGEDSTNEIRPRIDLNVQF